MMKALLTRRSLVAALVPLFMLCLSPVFAAEKAGLAEILSVVNRGYASMEDLHADFIQKTYVAALKREEKGSGELFLKKKGGGAQFSFNYVKPKQQIISNGKTVWYYLPENRQVIVTDTAKLFSGGNGLALSYLTGLGSLEADFEVRLLSELPDKKGDYQLELTPKKRNPAVSRLHLNVSSSVIERSRKSGDTEPFFPIASSVLFDQIGNRTTIEYSKIRINSGVGSSRFSFKPPAGVDIIRQ